MKNLLLTEMQQAFAFTLLYSFATHSVSERKANDSQTSILTLDPIFIDISICNMDL